jgi:hypothetical protein
MAVMESLTFLRTDIPSISQRHVSIYALPTLPLSVVFSLPTMTNTDVPMTVVMPLSIILYDCDNEKGQLDESLSKVSEEEAQKFKLQHGDKCDAWAQLFGSRRVLEFLFRMPFHSINSSLDSCLLAGMLAVMVFPLKLSPKWTVLLYGH